MPPKKLPDPTEAELEILQVLWRQGPSTVRLVWEALGAKGSYTTILKLLQIMLEKRLVRRDDAQHSHIYEAALSETDTQERMLTWVVDRAFAGSAGRLVMRALSEKRVSAAEMDAIRELLAQAEKKKP